ncbi:MAG: cysteine desulfurase [Clostridia bacterium]|nr:cysteine desulfurase [Clostridia bacterium]
MSAYLDNSATTKVCPQAAEKAAFMMTECFGNPSSLHSLGFAAERELTAARASVATLLKADPAYVTFTSGGTEANNLAILGAANAKKRRGHHVVTTAIEHPSVLEAFARLEADGFEVTRVLPQNDGTIDPRDLLAACRPDTILVSAMAVNNETGAIFSWDAVAPAVRRKSPLATLHCDCVQAAGKCALSFDKMGVDLCSVSGHKLHAPKGVGALFMKKGTRLIPPAALGGGQEKGVRSGTENMPAIAAFGEAVKALPAPAEQAKRYEALRAFLLSELADLDDVVVHTPRNAVSYITHLSLLGRKSETLVHALAEQEVFVSGGSACAKGKKSHVLEAMGLPAAEIDSSLRISFSHETTEDDIRAFCNALRTARDTLAHV